MSYIGQIETPYLITFMKNEDNYALLRFDVSQQNVLKDIVLLPCATCDDFKDDDYDLNKFSDQCSYYDKKQIDLIEIFPITPDIILLIYGLHHYCLDEFCPTPNYVYYYDFNKHEFGLIHCIHPVSLMIYGDGYGKYHEIDIRRDHLIYIHPTEPVAEWRTNKYVVCYNWESGKINIKYQNLENNHVPIATINGKHVSYGNHIPNTYFPEDAMPWNSNFRKLFVNGIEENPITFTIQNKLFFNNYGKLMIVNDILDDIDQYYLAAYGSHYILHKSYSDDNIRLYDCTGKLLCYNISTTCQTHNIISISITDHTTYRTHNTKSITDHTYDINSIRMYYVTSECQFGIDEIIIDGNKEIKNQTILKYNIMDNNILNDYKFVKQMEMIYSNAYQMNLQKKTVSATLDIYFYKDILTMIYAYIYDNFIY